MEKTYLVTTFCFKHVFHFRHEISILCKKSVLLSVVGALEYTSGAMATMVSVITLVLTGHPVTPVNVFMLLAFNNVLRLSISYYVAFGLLEIAEAYNSLNRIENFLLLEDIPIKRCHQTTENLKKRDKLSTTRRNNVENLEGEIIAETTLVRDPTTAIRLINLTCQQNNRDNPILHGVELHAASTSLTVITGPVGSGKSTLLSAIAGEVSQTSGTISYQSSLVYLPQMPWVFSGTVRENILFGESYDQERYTRVIEACALTEDIQQFPDYDRTIVGERGAVLSGGQRARVSLARAMYAHADIYVMDDPLSAVDVKVGQHIFEKCITGLLGRKTRVLTSHQEEHMKKADKVIVLYQGRVLGKGNFIELQEKGILSTTVDPLLNKTPTESEFDMTLVAEDKDGELTSSDASKGASNSQGKSLVIPREDRTIGVVSSKLYWNYFRTGIPVPVILVGTIFCFVTQGWPSDHLLNPFLSACSYKRATSAMKSAGLWSR